MDIDLEDIQHADQYNEVLPEVDVEEDGGISGGAFDFDDSSSTATFTPTTPEILPGANATSMLPPQLRRPSDDQSVILPQSRIYDEEPRPFNLALGLWCKETGISRVQYTSLREILRMLEPHPILNGLPKNYSVLRRRTKGQLPQLPLRQALLSLVPEKMPTLTERRKKKASEEISKEYLYFLDPDILFQSILRSTLLRKMHIGFGEFRDNPIELWQSNCWTALVRTSSGLYAHYRNSDTLFPSDWVLYRCAESDCDIKHLGCVVVVGSDYRDSTPPSETGELRIKVQHAYWNHEIPMALHSISYFQRNEVLLQSTYSFLEESAIIRRHETIIMDYSDESLSQRAPGSDLLIARSLLDENGWIQLVRFSAPLRAELELKVYERDYFCNNLDQAKGNRCISLPFMLFIDGFGLYRNAYRSLMGVYMQIAAFSFHERMRRANVFPLTLGPHGSNFDDFINAMQGLRYFDKGVVLELPQPTRVCAFTLCFLGDMPQQQANAGFKSQRANLGCRYCLIPAESRKDLNYDIIRNGRFHMQTMQQRSEMNAIRSTVKREEFASRWGLSTTEPALFKMTPALDIILTRPADPAHSEYAGMCKHMHTLLMETMLTTAGAHRYATVLRSWPFAPGFGRLQSPIHHLKSYSLSEHGKWIIVIPGLLRCWLRAKFIQPLYLEATNAYVNRYSVGLTATEFITKVFGLVAQSTCMLMIDELTERAQLVDVVKGARSHFQVLLEFAIVAANSNPRSRSATPSRRRASVEATQSILPSVETAENEPQVSAKARMTQKAAIF